MQPTIVFTAPAPSMILINGRFAGETGPDRPLMAPVAPFGALYAESMPLAPGYRPAAMKCVFSGGDPIPCSITGSSEVFAVSWPGNITEIEFGNPESRTEHFSMDGVDWHMECSGKTRLVSDNLTIRLPDRAMKPSPIRLKGIPALKGDIKTGGQYLVTLSPDGLAETGFLTADRIDTGEGDVVHSVSSLNDIVGHGRLGQWTADETGLRLLSSEPVWPAGGPSWPKSAEETAIAAVQAAMEGLWGEANNYFVPALADTSPLNAISDVCDLCLPMKYGMPESRPCVGLLKAEDETFARVTPLYYRAQMTGGMQGPWQIDWISL